MSAGKVTICEKKKDLTMVKKTNITFLRKETTNKSIYFEVS